MAKASKIEWCDATFNPWTGCTKVSPGCDHCYAEARMDTWLHAVSWGAGQPRKRTSEANWRQPLKWNAQQFVECGKCGWRGAFHQFLRIGDSHCPACDHTAYRPSRRRVFCASLADVFDNEVDPAWRHDLFNLIEATPNLDWLLLTKRVGNVERMVSEAGCVAGNGTRYWPSNATLGATITSQPEADRDIVKLLEAKAALGIDMVFLSMEPLLGPVDLFRVWEPGGLTFDALSKKVGNSYRGVGVDWVIAGGESGAAARPMHPDWARGLRDQCAAANVPFLFKQWGEWNPGTVYEAVHAKESVRIERSGAVHPWPPMFNPGGGDWCMHKVGKKAAGRVLDGVTHDGYPEHPL